MKSKEIQFILENAKKKSPKEIAAVLGLKERAVKRFIESNVKLEVDGDHQQAGALAHQVSKKSPLDIVKSFYINLLAIILISFLGIIVYSNTFFCSFHLDDVAAIVDNLFITNFHYLQNIWSLWPCRFITYLSYAFNYHFNGFNVFGYHLFNLAVHLGCAILVWWLTLMTFLTPVMKNPPAGEAGDTITAHANSIALFAGLIFVSHPVQVEAVTYIMQRSACMATLFYLASVGFYVKSRLLQTNQSTSGSGASCRTRVVTRKFYYIGSLLLAMAAMFTKEMSLTLPLTILLYEFSFFRTNRNINWKPLIPFLLTLFIIPLTLLLTKSVTGVISSTLSDISPWQYLLTQFRVIVTYLRLLVIPIHQNLDYDYPIARSVLELPTLASLILLGSIVTIAVRIFSRYRLISFGIFWFFLTLLVESSIIPIKDVIFEHRLYLPLVGYSMFLASGVYYLLGKNTIKTMVIALMMIIACDSVLAYQRNKVWKDDFTLWDDTVGKSPHKARPYGQRGLSYDKQGNFTQAMSDYNKAIELMPTYWDAYTNRGLIYAKQGNLTQAVSDFNKTIELNPKCVEAYINRGSVYDDQGNLTQAMLDYNKVIELNSNYAKAYNARGIIYAKQGNYIQAMSDFTKAIEINPKITEAYQNRAFAEHYLKEYDKSWADVHKAEELGQAVNAEFLADLKKVSGREK